MPSATIAISCSWDGGSPATFTITGRSASGASAHQIDDLWAAIGDCFTEEKERGQGSSTHHLTYLDEDGDEVVLASEADVADAVQQATRRSPPILEVMVRPSLHQLAASVLGEEWESVQEVGAPSMPVAQPADEAAPAAAKAEEEAKPDDVAPLVASSTDDKAEVDGSAPVLEVASAAVVEEHQQEQAAPVADVPVQESEPQAAQAPVAASPAAASSWTLMSLFGRGNAQPSADQLSASASSQTSLSSVSSLSSSSSAEPDDQPKDQAASQEKEFWEMDDHNVADSQSNSFTGAQFAPQGAWDSTVMTSNALSAVLTSMLARTEERFGLDASANVSAGQDTFVRQPHQALLSALHGLNPSDFDEVCTQFVEVCVRHAERRESDLKQKEENRLREQVRLLEAETEARAAEDAARAAEAEAEAARIEAVRLEAECAAEHEARVAAEAARAAELALRLAASRSAQESALARRAALQEAAEAEQAQLELMAKKMAQLRADQEAADQEAQAAQREQELLAQEQAQGALPVPMRAAPQAQVEGLYSQPPAASAAVDADRYSAAAIYAVAALPVVDRHAELHPISLPRAIIVDNSQIPRLNSPMLPAVPLVSIPVATPLAAAAHSQALRFNNSMQELRDMGFVDDELNTCVLQKTNCDIGAAIDWLMSNDATGGELKQEFMQQAQQ